MGSFPDEADLQDLTDDHLLARIRAGLHAEDELIVRYLDKYSQEDSASFMVLNTLFRKAAEKVGADVLGLVGMLLAERRVEVIRSIDDFATTEDFEARIGRKVRREIWRLSKRNQRDPMTDSSAIDGVGERGYQPGSHGPPRSTILFEKWDGSLESAIRKVQGKNDDQRRLFEVLARLHVLKGWGYEKLARLVFGPGQEVDELRKNGDRIRKWIQEPIRHVRAEKRRNQKRRKEQRLANGDEPVREANDSDSTGDDRA